MLAEFSGYIAADELYDGPFCVLSIVDNRTFRRILYEVLDHDPKHADIIRFFRTFRSALDARGGTLAGITTDGSNLYPEPIGKVFGEVPHQVCEFHVIKELTQAGYPPSSPSGIPQEQRAVELTMVKFSGSRGKRPASARGPSDGHLQK